MGVATASTVDFTAEHVYFI